MGRKRVFAARGRRKKSSCRGAEVGCVHSRPFFSFSSLQLGLESFTFMSQCPVTGNAATRTKNDPPPCSVAPWGEAESGKAAETQGESKAANEMVKTGEIHGKESRPQEGMGLQRCNIIQAQSPRGCQGGMDLPAKLPTELPPTVQTMVDGVNDILKFRESFAEKESLVTRLKCIYRVLDSVRVHRDARDDCAYLRFIGRFLL